MIVCLQQLVNEGFNVYLSRKVIRVLSLQNLFFDQAVAASRTNTACLLNYAKFLRKLVSIKRHPILIRLHYDL